MDGRPEPIFRSIAEVALMVDVSQHVLRFWEDQIGQLRPLRTAGGRRRYRPEDIEFIMGIRVLLHVHGFTMEGVRKVIADHGINHVRNFWRQDAKNSFGVLER